MRKLIVKFDTILKPRADASFLVDRFLQAKIDQKIV